MRESSGPCSALLLGMNRSTASRMSACRVRANWSPDDAPAILYA
jgi:hypothetical protein